MRGFGKVANTSFIALSCGLCDAKACLKRSPEFWSIEILATSNSFAIRTGLNDSLHGSDIPAERIFPCSSFRKSVALQSASALHKRTSKLAGR